MSNYKFLTDVSSHGILVLIMHDLTQRQIEILKSLIEEYIETASPVGSETLEKKHNLSASPATIRNEMVRLTELSYLQKPHTSAGRVPTPMGMKFYVTQLMKEKELSVKEEVTVKEKVWDYRASMEAFMRELTRALAERTGTLALATTNAGNFYTAGFALILDKPEFFDIDMTKTLLTAIDELESLRTMFASVTDEEVHVLMGDDLGPLLPGPYGCVFTHYKAPNNFQGSIGVMGPVRLNYTNVVPTVRYFGDLAEEMAKEWQ